MALDYYKMVKALFGFRNSLPKIETERNGKLINYILNKNLEFDDDDLVYPDAIVIAKVIGVAKHKVRGMIQALYSDLLLYHSDNSLILKKAVKVLYIHFPYNEEECIHKNYREEAKRLSLWLQVDLPVIPRLGETINLVFIESDLKYNHGYVVEIDHDITCSVQRTIIHVHPLKNYFHHWAKQGKRHEPEQANR
jgi:hypothetical protein